MAKVYPHLKIAVCRGHKYYLFETRIGHGHKPMLALPGK